MFMWSFGPILLWGSSDSLGLFELPGQDRALPSTLERLQRQDTGGRDLEDPRPARTAKAPIVRLLKGQYKGHMCVCMYIYILICIHICMCICIYVYICIASVAAFELQVWL